MDEYITLSLVTSHDVCIEHRFDSLQANASRYGNIEEISPAVARYWFLAGEQATAGGCDKLNTECSIRKWLWAVGGRQVCSIIIIHYYYSVSPSGRWPKLPNDLFDTYEIGKDELALWYVIIFYGRRSILFIKWMKWLHAIGGKFMLESTHKHKLTWNIMPAVNIRCVATKGKAFVVSLMCVCNTPRKSRENRDEGDVDGSKTTQNK